MENLSLSSFSNLGELCQYFISDEKCRKYLTAIRWKNGEFCPYCGNMKLFHFKDGKNHKCAGCRKRFSIKVGTIFEDTKAPLLKWYMAIYLLSSHKKGISSLQLAKDIGVTQKTAWFMLHRIRYASVSEAFKAPLKNIVEADETYIGGKEKNKHANKRAGKNGKSRAGRSTAHKIPVLSVVERNGNIVAKKVDRVTTQTVGKFLGENVVIGARLMTDEFSVYKGVKWTYIHDSITHGTGEYVRGDVHTNTVEGFFGLLKRGIVGIYHYVSAKHLDNYLQEFTFRYNSRNYRETDRLELLIEACDGKRLTYNQLIQKI